MSSGKSVRWVIAVILVACIAALVWIWLDQIPKNVAYVSEEEGGIVVIDLDTLQVVKRVQPQNVAPRGLALTLDGNYLMTANKDTSDASVFDTRRLHMVRRIQAGDNPEFVKINPSGTAMFMSYEPGSTAGPPTEGPGGEDEDEQGPPSQIVEIRIQDWSRQQSFVAGLQTEGLEFSADGKKLIVANEAQNTLGIYDVDAGKLLENVDLGKIGRRPRGVKRSPLGNGYAVTMEGSGTLVMLDPDFKVVRTVQTDAKPYGVAFDRSGKRIFVAAAAAQKLQIFSADSLQQIGEAPIGKRCWHFTFTPDDSRVLLACGRSNNVYVIDANSYKQIKILGGFKVPWGIVAYPRSYGSLGLP
jgi:DNA-binding beta-propeller fold protein YncE